MNGVVVKRSTPRLEFTDLDGPTASVHLVRQSGATSIDWAYGGIRRGPSLNEAADILASRRGHPRREISQEEHDRIVQRELVELGLFESGVKHALINLAVDGGLVQRLRDYVAFDLLDSWCQPGCSARDVQKLLSDEFVTYFSADIKGGRCIYVPKNKESATRLTNPDHPEHFDAVTEVFLPVAIHLNEIGGALKLTPDLGRNAHIGDILFPHTSHILGISSQHGGIGGKSAYTTSGIRGALEALGVFEMGRLTPVTVVGHQGALGSQILKWFDGFHNLAVADIRGDDTDTLPTSMQRLPSKKGAFSDEAISRGGVFISTTLSQELANSNWLEIPSGTIMLLAQNHGLPRGKEGQKIAQTLHDKGVILIPGPILTLAGAQTARLEWAYRQTHYLSKNGENHSRCIPALKTLAHIAAKETVRKLVGEFVLQGDRSQSPYGRMMQRVNERELWD